VKRGLSLLEVLLGNFLILLVILAVFALLAGTLRLAESSERRLQAEATAQQILEAARNNSPKELPAGNYAYSLDSFEVKAEIATVPDFDADQLKEVRVKVQWFDNGRQQSLCRVLRVCGLEDR